MRLAAFTLALCLLAGFASAEEAMIVKKSTHDVAATVDKLEQILNEKGLTVFARIDHAGGAANVGMELRPTELIVFGNPKLGTPLMQSNQRIGLDLPIRVVAWEDESGQAWIGYVDPAAIRDRYGITDRDKVFETMTGALAGITDAATQ